MTYNEVGKPVVADVCACLNDASGSGIGSKRGIGLRFHGLVVSVGKPALVFVVVDRLAVQLVTEPAGKNGFLCD